MDARVAAHALRGWGGFRVSMTLWGLRFGCLSPCRRVLSWFSAGGASYSEHHVGVRTSALHVVSLPHSAAFVVERIP